MRKVKITHFWQLIKICKVLKSFEEITRNFKNEHFDLKQTNIEDISHNRDAIMDLTLTKLEFVELLCRVATILGTNIIQLLSELLSELLSLRYANLWQKNKYPVCLPIHNLFPRNMELAQFVSP